MPISPDTHPSIFPALRKRDRFFKGVARLDALACPHCGQRLIRQGDGLACGANHHWNVHRKGYVTFQRRGDEARYGSALFQARERVFAAGLYDPVVQALLEAIPREAATLLDAGCGEGWYTASLLSKRPALCAMGVDLSTAAIALATDHPVSAVWCVGDLCRLPLLDASMDVVLDVLSPAAYDDFRRVLRPGGLLLKVYPQAGYLQELRHAAGLAAYTPGEVERRLRQQASIQRKVPLQYTVPVNQALWADLVHMTPMLASLTEAEKEKVTQAPGAQVTMDLMLAVCSIR